MTKISKKKRFV